MQIRPMLKCTTAKYWQRSQDMRLIDRHVLELGMQLLGSVSRKSGHVQFGSSCCLGSAWIQPVFNVYYTVRVAETDVEIVRGQPVEFT